MSDVGARKTTEQLFAAVDTKNPFSFKAFTAAKNSAVAPAAKPKASAAQVKRPSIFDNDASGGGGGGLGRDDDDDLILPSGVPATAAPVPNDSFLANVPPVLDPTAQLRAASVNSATTTSASASASAASRAAAVKPTAPAPAPAPAVPANDSFDSDDDDAPKSKAATGATGAPVVSPRSKTKLPQAAPRPSVATPTSGANDTFESDDDDEDDDIESTPLSRAHVLKPPTTTSSAPREKELRLRAEVAEMALKETQAKLSKLSAEHEALRKAHETMRLDLDSANRKVQRLKAKDEQETSTLNDMVERIEQNLLQATQRAQTAEARVADLERQLGRDRDAAEEAQTEVLGDEESRQLLKLYRGRLRMCQESGADASARLARSMQVVLGAMKQIHTTSADMQVIVDTLKTFGRVALVEKDGAGDNDTF
jgi:hypothetical protein